MPESGYAGEILRIDLTKKSISRLPTSVYADRFLGGRGIAAKIYWDETSQDTRALDPDNCLICITGPLAGFMGLAGCRWQMCGKSPQTEPESFSYANLGGSWGAWLKYAGYDGLAVIGKAEHPVYILITDDEINICSASHLRNRTTVETENIFMQEMGKDVRVLSIGPAGENLVSFATVLASDNAAGSGGFGSVMGSKNLKAVVIKIKKKKKPTAADPEKLKILKYQVFKLRTENYENYGHMSRNKSDRIACYGCISGCDRQQFPDGTGRRYKSFCQASSVYTGPAMKFYGMEKAADVYRLAGRLCDQYGLDTAVLQPLISWLNDCHNAEILTEKDTGLPLSRIGSAEFIEKLVEEICYRKGFGNVLADGLIKAAKHVGRDSEKFLSAYTGTKAGETLDYDPRYMIVSSLIHATEPRRAIQLLHGIWLPVTRWLNYLNGYDDAFLSNDKLREISETYWGGIDALDFSVYDGKAQSAKTVQDYGYIKESMIICDLAWPIYHVRYSIKGIEFCTIESRILSAITGRDMDENEFLRIGERIFNLQRAVFQKQGWGGRKGDTIPDQYHDEPLERMIFNPECIAPGRDGKKVSRKGAVIERDKFESLKGEYYALRGWDVESGLQARSKLDELQMNDIADELERLGLLR